MKDLNSNLKDHLIDPMVDRSAKYMWKVSCIPNAGQQLLSMKYRSHIMILIKTFVFKVQCSHRFHWNGKVHTQIILSSFWVLNAVISIAGDAKVIGETTFSFRYTVHHKGYLCTMFTLCYGLAQAYFEGILPKGPYPPCLRMADRALLAGYPRFYLYPSGLL